MGWLSGQMDKWLFYVPQNQKKYHQQGEKEIKWRQSKKGLHKKDLERQRGKTTNMKDDKNEVWNMGWENAGGEETLWLKSQFRHKMKI